MIPTAEEFIEDNERFQFYERFGNWEFRWDTVYKFAIEFAKLHVEAALKTVIELDLEDISKFPEANDYDEGLELYILNSYPLTNIQ